MWGMEALPLKGQLDVRVTLYCAKAPAAVVPAPVETDAGPRCHKPPAGWRCTRGAGHYGPCAAVETDDPVVYRWKCEAGHITETSANTAPACMGRCGAPTVPVPVVDKETP